MEVVRLGDSAAPGDAVLLIPDVTEEMRGMGRESDRLRAELHRSKVLTNTLAQDSRRIATALHAERAMRDTALRELNGAIAMYGDLDPGLERRLLDVREALGVTDDD